MTAAAQTTILSTAPAAETDAPLVAAAKAVIAARTADIPPPLGAAIDDLDRALARFLAYGHLPY